MANDDIWILGINMTKFGKHPDKDVVDLASEAALAALADGGVTIKDMGVLAAGNLMGAAAGIGQQLQKQIGQTGIPVFNVANACATGATALRTVIMAIKAGECDMGLAVGVEKLSGAGMLGAGFGVAASDEWTPAGRYGAVSGFEGKLGTDMMPGVFAQVGMEYLHQHPYDGADFELFAGISAKNHFNSTMNPLAAIQKDMSVEQIMAEPMIAYPNTRAMCSANSDGAAAAVVVSGAKLRTLSKEQQKRCEGFGVGAYERSVPRGLSDPPRRQHPHPYCCQAGVRTCWCWSGRSRPRGTSRLFRNSRTCSLRQPHAVQRRQCG